jgi:hypothetical protein
LGLAASALLPLFAHAAARSRHCANKGNVALIKSSIRFNQCFLRMMYIQKTYKPSGGHTDKLDANQHGLRGIYKDGCEKDLFMK